MGWQDEYDQDICHRAFERAAKKAEEWTRADHIRLHAGEMTAQEMRTAQAVARGIAASIRDLK